MAAYLFTGGRVLDPSCTRLLEGVNVLVEDDRILQAEIEPDDTFSYTALSVIYQRCGKIPEAEHAKAIAFNKQHGLD